MCNGLRKNTKSIMSGLLGLLLFAVAWGSVCNATEITGFSPIGGPAGTVVTITGKGFSGTTKVIFNSTGSLLSADFIVESDSTIRAIAPDNPWRGKVSLLISGSQGATVSLLESSTRINKEAYRGNGGDVVLVESTGFINGLGGGNVVYVEAGGTVTNRGSGGNIFILEAQATLNCCGGGGSNKVYYEAGAIITKNTNHNSGYVAYEVADVKASFIPSLYDYNHQSKFSGLDVDADRDGITDLLDNCPIVSNPLQKDTDLDGSGDTCDADDDNDGVNDTIDNCPLESNTRQENTNGSAAGNACHDNDNDGINDAKDNCPLIMNRDQADTDKDGDGDICDLGFDRGY